MKNVQEFARQICRNIDTSPTAFHAVDTMRSLLLNAGFKELQESDPWNLTQPGKYFTTRNSSSIAAFVLGEKDILKTGVRVIGAHTDSPCLKVKPIPEIKRKNYLQLGVEVYGGVLLHPWFDRDLALAGRVSFINEQQQVQSCLLNINQPLAVIPSLAIHLNREANSKSSINSQLHLAPVIGLNSAAFSFEAFLREQIQQQHPTVQVGDVLDYEMSFYDYQQASLLGLQQELLSSARLDNLLSCFVALESLLQADHSVTSILVCNDHEEVGSASACGAQGPFLKSILERIVSLQDSPLQETLTRVLDASMMVSADNAHAVHPNYMDKHEPLHLPLLNHGPVLKINANQRYASNSETQTAFAYCCERAGVNLQKFVTRTDLGCGSTIGPITATNIGIPTVDVGIPSLAMHSIRETAGSHDLLAMQKALTSFLNLDSLWAR